MWLHGSKPLTSFSSILASKLLHDMMAASKRLLWSISLILALNFAVLLVSTGADQCPCTSETKCKCCRVISLDHKLREVRINDTVCVKVRSLKNKKGFRFAVIWNKKNLISHRLTTDKVPPFCFSTPFTHYLDVCLWFNDLKIERTRIKGCLQFEINSGASSKMFPSGCFQVQRKGIASNEPEGNLFNLLRSTSTKQIQLKSGIPLKDVQKAINQSSLTVWMKMAENSSTLRNKLLGQKSSRDTARDGGNTPTLSPSDCWCTDHLFVICECCVPIKNQDIQQRGCIKLAHIPYSKEINLRFVLDENLKITEYIPSTITKRLCANQKISNNLKLAACLKPLPYHGPLRNRSRICIDINVRKHHIRRKYRVGCVSIVVVKPRG